MRATRTTRTGRSSSRRTARRVKRASTKRAAVKHAAKAVRAPIRTIGKKVIVTLEPMLEQNLLESLRPSETGAFMAIDGMRAEAMVTEAGRLVEAAEQQGITPVLACSPQLRLPLMRLLRAGSRRVQVLSYSEISGSTAQIETMGVVNGAYAGAA